jgi:oligosaccharide repeat unit polymerase
MSMPSIAISLTIAVILLFVSLRAFGTPLTHPALLTTIPQLLLVAFACTNLLHKLHGFHLLTWVVVLGSSASFLAGCFVVFLSTRNWKPSPPSEVIRYRDPWALMFIGFSVYLVAYAAGFYRVGGMPILSAHPEHARLFFIAGYFHEFLTSFMVPTVTLCLTGLRPDASKAFRWTAISIGLCTILLYLSTGNRWFSLFFLVNILVFLDVMVKTIRLRTTVLVASIGILVFMAGGYLRYGRFAASARKIEWTAVGKLGLQGVYSYAGNGFWNLDYALERMEMDKLRVPTYGASSSEGFLVLIGASNQLKEAYGWDGALNFSVMKLQGLNSTSFHWALIKDFGVGFPMLWSFVVGIGLSALSKYVRLKKSLRGALIFGHFSFYSFIGFLIFPFIIPPPVSGTALLCLATLFFRRKTEDPVSQESR